MADELENTTANYIRNAKSYSLAQMQIDDDFLDEVTVPFEKIQDLIARLNGDYSKEVLSHVRSDLCLIFSQDFESLAQSMSAKDIVFISYNMLLFELYEDAEKQMNILCLMLEGLEACLVRNNGIEIDKVIKKVLGLVRKLVVEGGPMRLVIIQLFYTSFNSVSEKLHFIDSEEIVEYYSGSLDLIGILIDTELQIVDSEERTVRTPKYRV